MDRPSEGVGAAASRIQRAHAQAQAANILENRSKEEALADKLRLSRDVKEVDWEGGKGGVRYYVTFDGEYVPAKFDEFYDLEFIGAWTTYDRFHWWEWFRSRVRITALFRRDSDDF